MSICHASSDIIVMNDEALRGIAYLQANKAHASASIIRNGRHGVKSVKRRAYVLILYDAH